MEESRREEKRSKVTIENDSIELGIDGTITLTSTGGTIDTKERRLIDKVAEEVKNKIFQYEDEIKMTNDIINTLDKDLNINTILKLRLSKTEQEKTIDKLKCIKSRINFIIDDMKEEQSVIKDPIKELRDEIKLRRDVVDKEIKTLVDMKKLLNKDDDKDACDRIELIKLAKLQDKNIFNSLLTIINEEVQVEDVKQLYVIVEHMDKNPYVNIVGVYEDIDECEMVFRKLNKRICTNEDREVRNNLKLYIKDAYLNKYFL